MRILLSPAKKMREGADFLPPRTRPALLEQAARLADYLRSLAYPDLKGILACNDQIASLNYRRYQDMDLSRPGMPALLSYDGIQYQYMAPHLFTREQYDYVQDHVRVLSGLYGVLRPFDGVVPYRLELGARFRTDFCASLYDYWGDTLCRTAAEGDPVLLNLASEEYAKGVRPWAAREIALIDVVFGELEGDRLVEKGVYVKMARGEMVRFLAERGAERPEEAQAFDRMGYRYAPERSQPNRYVFVRTEKPGGRARRKLGG